jgi:hypothetical protein
MEKEIRKIPGDLFLIKKKGPPNPSPKTLNEVESRQRSSGLDLQLARLRGIIGSIKVFPIAQNVTDLPRLSGIKCL